MIRAAELSIFFVPLLAYVLWRVSIARGMPGPPPRQLAVILVGLMLAGAGLAYLAAHEKLPPGRYVPAAVVNGQIVQGHSE